MKLKVDDVIGLKKGVMIGGSPSRMGYLDGVRPGQWQVTTSADISDGDATHELREIVATVSKTKSVLLRGKEKRSLECLDS